MGKAKVTTGQDNAIKEARNEQTPTSVQNLPKTMVERHKVFECAASRGDAGLAGWLAKKTWQASVKKENRGLLFVRACGCFLSH